MRRVLGGGVPRRESRPHPRWGRADPGRPLRDRFGIGSVYPLGVSTALAAVPGNADAAAARFAVGGAVLLAPFALGALADRVGIGAALGVVLPMLLAAALLALAAGWGRLAGS